jgi:hypothetical protein
MALAGIIVMAVSLGALNPWLCVTLIGLLMLAVAVGRGANR